jgi:hypothetical protein
MKNKSLQSLSLKKVFIYCCISFSFNAFAQKDIVVDEAPRAMSRDTQFSYLVDIPQATLKTTEKNWLSYLSAESKGNATFVNGEHLQTEVNNKNISSQPVNIYSKLIETTEGVRLTVWITEKNFSFIANNPNSIEDLAIQKFVRDFAVKEYKEAVQEEFKIERNKQEEMEKTATHSTKNFENSNKKIGKEQRTILQSKDNISTNTADIARTTLKIEEQKKMVEKTAADPNATKGAKKTLHNLEKSKESLQKKNDQLSRKIEDAEKDIREEVKNAGAVQQNEALLNPEIEAQKLKVNAIQTKLNNIK